jgi:hypothetical protein
VPGELDGAVALARSDFGDHLVGHARRLVAVHDELDDTGAQAHTTPLQLDPGEQVTGKQRR